MQIYTTIKKGEYHPVFCEDFLVNIPIGTNLYLGAVMDGCSGGKDSHFASALFGKLLQKITRDLIFNTSLDIDSLSVENLAKTILKQFFQELKQLRNQLALGLEDILSTLTLLVYNKKSKQVFIIVLGDGFVTINGKITEIDQNNKPDYPAYHLEEDFEIWFNNQENIFTINNPKDISISTDGIDTLTTDKEDLPENFNPIDFLLKDKSFSENENMLNYKYNILTKKYEYNLGDDLSIIRLIC